MNLFIALLLSSFGSERLRNTKDEATNKTQEAIARIKLAFFILSEEFNKIRKRGNHLKPIAKNKNSDGMRKKSSFFEVGTLKLEALIKKKATSNERMKEIFLDFGNRASMFLTQIRLISMECVEKKCFEYFILALIILSSVLLVILKFNFNNFNKMTIPEERFKAQKLIKHISKPKSSFKSHV